MITFIYNIYLFITVSALFGFNQYGTHINGYTFRDGELIMWIGRRSKTKPTFPNMLDNMVRIRHEPTVHISIGI